MSGRLDDTVRTLVECAEHYASLKGRTYYIGAGRAEHALDVWREAQEAPQEAPGAVLSPLEALLREIPEERFQRAADALYAAYYPSVEKWRGEDPSKNPLLRPLMVALSVLTQD